jgi:hypothetical protein
MFDRFSMDQLQNLASLFRWALFVFGSFTVITSFLSYKLADRIQAIQKQDKAQSVSALEATETKLRSAQSKIQELEVASKPRTLSDTQIADIKFILAKEKQHVGIVVCSEMQKVESQDFGDQLTDTIHHAGWEVLHNKVGAHSFKGLRVVPNGPVGDTEQIIRFLFTKVGIQIEPGTVNINQCGYQHSPAVYIFVGEKP